jgi:hypothetical protein
MNLTRDPSDKVKLMNLPLSAVPIPTMFLPISLFVTKSDDTLFDLPFADIVT